MTATKEMKRKKTAAHKKKGPVKRSEGSAKKKQETKSEPEQTVELEFEIQDMPASLLELVVSLQHLDDDGNMRGIMGAVSIVKQKVEAILELHTDMNNPKLVGLIAVSEFCAQVSNHWNELHHVIATHYRADNGPTSSNNNSS